MEKGASQQSGKFPQSFLANSFYSQASSIIFSDDPHFRKVV
ncbi:hypothetical protein NEIMUCOT_06343 [Neisseria mucosa ATCC 25996]|uniref:Uncharacterized protein n=1 Tax=Neisseria mucosa (strain ATCC 25996 / DSM 4631 / NCTC 10774 / M26) TaxID=546266 RepID=D3A0A8_NEIM2|nr:hypothetical protein NEIMUCOT_06343 [Neisseria mucosa ATCC 25996]